MLKLGQQSSLNQVTFTSETFYFFLLFEAASIRVIHMVQWLKPNSPVTEAIQKEPVLLKDWSGWSRSPDRRIYARSYAEVRGSQKQQQGVLGIAEA